MQALGPHAELSLAGPPSACPISPLSQPFHTPAPHLCNPPSQVGEHAGFGVFLDPSAAPAHTPRRRWWWPLPFGGPPPFATLASFPLATAISAANITAEPEVRGARARAWVVCMATRPHDAPHLLILSWCE